MSERKVLQAISNVMADLAEVGIGKNQQNREQGYAYRGIDDIYNALAPILVKNKLLIMPSVVERTVSERPIDERMTRNKSVMHHVVLRVEYTFLSTEDASTYELEIYSEATDMADKATNKAMSAAYKYACIQAFCIPLVGLEDPDAVTPPEAVVERHAPLPPVPKVEDVEDAEAPLAAEERMAMATTLVEADHDDAIRGLAAALLRVNVPDKWRRDMAEQILARRAELCAADGVDSVKKMAKVFMDRGWLTAKHKTAAVKVMHSRFADSEVIA